MSVRGKVSGGICFYEPLEKRQLFALALVHQELHRPPTAIADVNGDGLADMVVATTNLRGVSGGLGAVVNGFDVYLNNGKGDMILTGHTDCDDHDPSIASEIVVADFNKDRAPDVAMKLFSVVGQPTPVGRVPLPQAKLILFGGSGKGDFKQLGTVVLPHSPLSILRSALQPNVFSNSGLAVADMDRDGLPDIVSWVGNDVCAFNTGPRQTTSLDGSWATSRSGDARFVAAGDLDGDGRGDLIAVVDGAITYASYDFSPGKPPALGRVNKIEAISFKQSVYVQLGDLDGDGRADDLVLQDMSTGVIREAINDSEVGKGFSVKTLATRESSVVVLVGDVNGDHTDELFKYVGTVTIVK